MFLFGNQVNSDISLRPKPKNTNKTMKNLLTVLALAASVSFVACGPSQADIDKENKRITDSTDSANKVAADAEAAKMQHEADSMKAIQDAAAKVMADSLHADSVKRKLIKK